MKNRLLIIGAGGLGKIAANVAMNMNTWNGISFLDDDESIKACMGIDIIGKIADALTYKDNSDFFVALGNNFAREKYLRSLEAGGASIVKLVHRSSVIQAEVEIGNGTAVMAGAVINCVTRIGRGCIINTAATIGHDCVIEDYAHLSPGVRLAGTVKIGKSTWLGIGSVVINNISICDNCIIGAGAVVVKDITESGTYVGVPAKKVI